MKMNKLLVIGCTAALILTMGVTAFAATTNSTSSSGAAAATQATGKEHKTLTADQIAEREAMKANMEASIKKWDALSAEDKESVYALEDEVIAAQSAVIDKELELGVIDEAAAAEMKARLTEKSTDMRTDGKMPMLGGGGMHGGPGGFKHDAPDSDESTSNSTSTSTTTTE